MFDEGMKRVCQSRVDLAREAVKAAERQLASQRTIASARIHAEAYAFYLDEQDN